MIIMIIIIILIIIIINKKKKKKKKNERISRALNRCKYKNTKHMHKRHSKQ